MLGELKTLENTIIAEQTKVRVHAENIAGAEVHAFKKREVKFSAIFSKMLRQGTVLSDGGDGATNQQQLSMGAKVSGISKVFSLGSKVESDPISIYINNPKAFFVAARGSAATSSEDFIYTRSGNLSIYNNELITPEGLHIYGYEVNNGQLSNQLQPIYIRDDIDASWLSWDEEGRLLATNPDTGEQEVLFQVAVTTFPNPSLLQTVADNAYKGNIASGEATGHRTPTESSISITGGVYEGSNVEVMEEALKGLLPTERYMQAGFTAFQAILNIVDKFLQSVSG